MTKEQIVNYSLRTQFNILQYSNQNSVYPVKTQTKNKRADDIERKGLARNEKYESKTIHIQNNIRAFRTQFNILQYSNLDSVDPVKIQNKNKPADDREKD